jgi:hypothetical protein
MNRSRLLAPAALVLVAALATGCGRTTTSHTHGTPVCAQVTTSAHGDYVAPGHRPCLLTTPRPARRHVTVVHHTTVAHPATTAPANLTKPPTPTAKTLKPVPTRPPVHLNKPPAPAPKAAPPKAAKPSKSKSR